MCEISNLSVYVIFLFDFGTVPTVWYFLFFILLTTNIIYVNKWEKIISVLYTRVRRSRDRMVDGFTTTGAISAYRH